MAIAAQWRSLGAFGSCIPYIVHLNMSIRIVCRQGTMCSMFAAGEFRSVILRFSKRRVRSADGSGSNVNLNFMLLTSV